MPALQTQSDKLTSSWDQGTRQKTEPNYYEILDLSLPSFLRSSLALDSEIQQKLHSSDKEQFSRILKQAYHRALLLHHPDKTTNAHHDNEDATKHLNDAQNGVKKTVAEFTISQIQQAYTTLADPVKRSEYDRILLLQKRRLKYTSKNTHYDHDGGWELVDLDEFEYHHLDDLEQLRVDGSIGTSENDRPILKDGSLGVQGSSQGIWRRKCRCGDPLGFVITEEELETEIEIEKDLLSTSPSEILVSCRGCSLVIRVLFAVENDQDDA